MKKKAILLTTLVSISCFGLGLLALNTNSVNREISTKDLTAYADTNGGTFGNGLTWNYNGEGTITISGEGAIPDMEIWDLTLNIYWDAPWSAYQNNIEKVVIDEGITSIGRTAFWCCPNLKTVVLPSTVSEIGTARNSDGYIHEFINDLPAPAFQHCDIEEYIISENNPYFKTIDGNIYSKDGNTFVRYATGKAETSFVIPEGVEEIGGVAFYESNLCNITIPYGVKRIGHHAFELSENITDIIIPDKVTSIGKFAFHGCTNLKSISFPESIVSFEDGMYYCDCLSDVYFRGTEEQWNESVLSQISNLAGSRIHFIDGSEKGVGWNYDEDNAVLTIFGSGKMRDYDNVSPWHSYGDSIQSVVIEDGVINIGTYAFRECRALTSVTIPESVKCISRSAFLLCESLEYITIPKSVTSIEDSAFMGSGLKSVVIPDSVTSIQSDVFCNCSSLTSITIPNSITSISQCAFYNCNSLTDVYYTGTQEEWNAITIGIENESLANAMIHYNYVEQVEEASLKSASLILDGTIMVNFKMEANETFVENGGYVTYATTYCDNGTFKNVERTYALSALEVKEGYYTLKVGMNPAQMNDTITVTLFSGESVQFATVDYSVRQYCESRIEKSNDDDMIALAKAILNYGSSVQEYVGYKTETLANASLSEADKAVVDVHEIYTDLAYNLVATSRIDGIAKTSASLLLDSTTSIRFKITLAEGVSVSDYSFKLNGNDCAVDVDGDVCYVKASGIRADRLADMYTLTVEKDEQVMTIEYGAWTYAQRVSSLTGQKMMKAMQLYSEATLNYMN